MKLPRHARPARPERPVEITTDLFSERQILEVEGQRYIVLSYQEFLDVQAKEPHRLMFVGPVGTK